MKTKKIINNDIKMIKYMKEFSLKTYPDIIIIDEAQDMTPLYSILVNRIFTNLDKQYVVCFTGDKF